MKVCEKVKKKGTTSYNEVADELVGEFTNPAHINSLTDQVFIPSDMDALVLSVRKLYCICLFNLNICITMSCFAYACYPA